MQPFPRSAPQAKTAAIVQARMGSSRLPGKMLYPLRGQPLIDYSLGRLTSLLDSPESSLDFIVLATSVHADNDALVAHVRSQWPQVQIVRGPEDDVLARFLSAIEITGATYVLRATGDCPCINLEAASAMLQALQKEGCDVVNYQPGFEYADKGLEAVTATALRRVASWPDLSGHDREHVTSLLYRIPDVFSVGYIPSRNEMRRGDLRLTVDTPQDIQFFTTLLEAYPDDIRSASLLEIVSFLDGHPEIAAINASAGRKSTRHERARLGFRCDGGTHLGLGHIVGSLRMARLLATELGVGAEFVVRNDPSSLSLINKAGFAMEVLSADLEVDLEIDRLIEKAAESDWSGIVFNFCKDDLERRTPDFHKIKEAGIPLIFMDNPLPPSWEEGDLVINALPHPVYPGYEPEKHSACVDGLEYFLLQEPSSDVPRHIPEFIQRVLISMGGGDASNLTCLVIRALVEAKFMGHVDVIIGAASPFRKEAEDLLSSSGLRGAVSFNVSDMPQRMRDADLGFTALGLSTYEMAAVGLPAGIISGTSLNGEAARQYVEAYKAAVYLGEGHHLTPGNIAQWFTQIDASVPLRTSLSQRGKRVGSAYQKIPDLFRHILQPR